MLRSLLGKLKPLGTAVLLLAVGLAVAEVWLQCQQEPPTATHGARADEQDLTLLVPSQTTHHEMRRLYAPQGGLPDVALDFRTNSLGLRGPDVAVPKPAGVYRILLLGDDTVAGTHLAASDTLGQRLQQLLIGQSGQNVEVISAGVPGFCPLLSVLQYDRELKHLDPDLVILHFDMSDVADDAAYRRLLRSADGRKICCNADLARSGVVAKPLDRLFRSSALARFFQTKLAAFAQSDFSHGVASSLDRSAHEWTLPTPPDLRVEIQHALTPVTELHVLTTAENRRLVISTSPVFWQVIDPNVRSAVARRYGVVSRKVVTRDLPLQILQTFCDHSGLQFCNATGAFRAYTRRSAETSGTTMAKESVALFESDSTRLSKYGTALYAREIAGMLLQRSPSQRPPQSTRRAVPETR